MASFKPHYLKAWLEGRGFDTQWGDFTQPLTEMSTRNIKIIMFLGSKVRRVRKADNLTAICEPIV
jgi:hypothetical protein